MGTDDLAGLTGDHVLPEIDFDEIARGEGGPHAIRRLVSAEYSRRLLLVRLILDFAAARPGLLGPLPGPEAVWRALEDLQANATSAEILRDVLLHPQLGVWMSHTLRAIVRSDPSDEFVWSEVGQIHCATFSAAIRAGIDLSTELPVRDGHVLLPTLGLVGFAGVTEDAVALATTSNGIASLRLADVEVVLPAAIAEDGTAWQALRRLDARANSKSIQVSLDDIDPFRDLADPIPPRRLSRVGVDTWSALLGDAWRTLTRLMPDYAEAMSIGLRSLVPLPSNEDGIVRSASTGDGFGSVLLTRPPDSTSLAVTLAHEFQHTKLGALFHLTDLYDDNDTGQFYAPWRDDARPLVGLLQGVYAFLGITAFWRSRNQSESNQVDELEFAHARRQTWTGLRALRAARGLTPLGSRFVAGMTARLQPWMREPVSDAAQRAAWWMAADNRIIWRLRNMQPDLQHVEGLIEMRSGGGTAVLKFADSDPAPSSINEPHRRATLFKLDIQSPERLMSLRGGANDPDLDLVGGNALHAMSAYRAALSQDLRDNDAWTGLAMASVMQRVGLPWRALWHKPELVRAICLHLHENALDADPLAIAAWLEDNGTYRQVNSRVISS